MTLGYIRPESFAEGQFSLHPDAAAQTIGTRIGAPLDLTAPEAADGISRIVDESMASAGRAHAVESGKDLGAISALFVQMQAEALAVVRQGAPLCGDGHAADPL